MIPRFLRIETRIAKTNVTHSHVAIFVSCRHDVVMRGGEGAFQGAFHARLLCEAAEFSRHVNICFVRPPEYHIKEQIMFL